MSHSSNAANPRVSIAGRRAGASSPCEIEFTSTVEAVRELPGAATADTFVSPGFVDLQINGFAGVDYNDPATTHEAVAASIERLFRTGVTRFLPTVITGSEERIVGTLRQLAAAKQEFRRAGLPAAEALAGFHVEGPNISPDDGPRGAHPLQHVRPPDFEEFQRWQEAAAGEIRLVTLSPEYPEAPRYIASVVAAGVTVSIGHTRATAEQIGAAVDAGASMSTHLGNGAHALLPKTSNYIWDQLAEDRLTASFIVDGIHLPQAFVANALRCKGPSRAVLVTDALMTAMCQPGLYRLGAVEVELMPDQRVVVRGTSRLAGSGLSMDRAVANAVKLGGVSLAQALDMATVNPARAARLPGRQQGLAAGDTADLVRFRWDAARQSLTVLETFVAGKLAYRA